MKLLIWILSPMDRLLESIIKTWKRGTMAKEAAREARARFHQYQQMLDDRKKAIIPLAEAVLCEDCRNITSAKNSTCKCCGSSSIWSVINVLEKSSVDRLMERLSKNF